MKVTYGHSHGRKAISPVIATVILIAITLIAAVAIAGFVFGLFGSFTSSAQVAAIPTYSISHADVSLGFTVAAPTSTSCNTTAPTSGDFLTFQNTGTANTAILSITLTYGGTSQSIPVASGCTVTAGAGPVYILLTPGSGSLTAASSGEQFSASATLSNGGSVSATGTFG